MLKRTARAFWPDALVWTILAMAMALSLLLLADARAEPPAPRTTKEIRVELAPIKQVGHSQRSSLLAAGARETGAKARARELRAGVPKAA